jgi:Di-haem oxidoreductase, putative peroxidase
MLSSPEQTPNQDNKPRQQKPSLIQTFLRRRGILILLALILFFGFFAYQIDLVFPATPSLNMTYTLFTQPTAQEIGSYDVLGKVISKDEAASLLKTEEGKQLLLADNGAVEISEDLINLGRDAFYTETFGNEVFLTNVTGILDGPLNIGNLVKSILSLGGKPTTNLQVTMDRDMKVGDRTFRKGDILNTGLDVPARSLTPLGVMTHINKGKVQVGITCAACHASVDNNTGRIIEGAPNNDLDTGLILALATNSASWFRHTGVNPLTIARGDRTYMTVGDRLAKLPDAQALEDAVDTHLLSWIPGNFDSTGDIHNNPSQNPSSYTFGAFPYGWSGNAAIGWFHGLTTLNSNVHGTNSDQTAGTDSSQQILNIDKETYLGTILQNSANPKFRLPEGSKPSEFFQTINPTPNTPVINEVIPMPGYPKGSPFILDGLMASSPGLPVAAQINGMSAYQNSLAPPPRKSSNPEAVRHGAAIFTQAGCVECHSGRYFTNNRVIAQQEVKTQPSRARAQAAFARNFVEPKTYPSNTPVPLPENPPVLDVPKDITPKEDFKLAFAIGNPGGYKVPSLIGLYYTAPYLHDGGVAAGAEALKIDNNDYDIINPDQIGVPGTLLRGIQADPEASLRVLLDRNLRRQNVLANRTHPDLQQSNVDGSGHNYWVDRQAAFSTQEQSDLIEFLLSLDDDPEIIPNKSRK